MRSSRHAWGDSRSGHAKGHGLVVSVGRRLFPWRDVVLPWLASRLVVDLAMLVGASSLFGPALPWSSGFTGWDFGWYRQIAEVGYGAPPVSGVQSTWPFFPLFPGVVRVGDWMGMPSGLTAFLVNHAVFLVALAGVHRLASRHLPASAARLSVWALVLFPGSVSFSLGYPSAIFLAASVWAFCCLEERHDLGAAALGVVVTMVRPNGLLVVAAMGLFVLRSPGLAELRRAVLIAMPSALAIGLWCLQVERWTGDPFAFWTSKGAWEELTIIELIRTHDHAGLVHVAMAVPAALVILFAWRRLPLAWPAMVAAYLVPPALLAVVGLGRYASESFPVAIAAGDVLDRCSAKVLGMVLAASTCGLASFSVMVVRYDFVP